MEENLYDILKVKKTSNDDEIKKSYRKLAMEWHPDRNQTDQEEASKKFKQISNAYNILSDKQKRKKYDLYGSTCNNGIDTENLFTKFNYTTNYNTNGVFNKNDFDFNNIFQNFSTINEPNQIFHDLFLNLEDLYKGVNKNVKIFYKLKNGEKRDKILEIPIKPGFKDGTKIKFKSSGNQHLNKPTDDIIFIIKENKNSVFERQQNDLCINISVPYKKLIKNEKIEFETIDKIKMEIYLNYQDINSWKIKRVIPNKGMPYRKNTNSDSLSYGDLILNIIIEFPDFNNYQRKIIKGIL